jgi:hypothetical protein
LKEQEEEEGFKEKEKVEDTANEIMSRKCRR